MVRAGAKVRHLVVGVIALTLAGLALGGCGGTQVGMHSVPNDDSGGSPPAPTDADSGTGTAPGGSDGGTPDGSPTGNGQACTGKDGPRGDGVLLMTSGGLPRSAIVHVPESYDPAKKSMLVLNFHGYCSAGYQEVMLTGMNGSADDRGFIVVYPEGVATSWNAGDCCGTAWLDAVDDVAFVQDLLDELERQYCIDPKRVFATGMSNGAFLSHLLACVMSDRIAAIAPVSGVLGIDPGACLPTRPVPVLDFHGTADTLVPYYGGLAIDPQLGRGLLFESVPDTMEFWRRHNGCSAHSREFFQNGAASCVEWSGCAQNARTILCTIDWGGHTWPGGTPIPTGITSYDINATDTMIDFFEAHPMP